MEICWFIHLIISVCDRYCLNHHQTKLNFNGNRSPCNGNWINSYGRRSKYFKYMMNWVWLALLIAYPLLLLTLFVRFFLVLCVLLLHRHRLTLKKTFHIWYYCSVTKIVTFTVNDSPYSERMERKDSIRRFLREQFRDDKKKEKHEKESKESKENKENIANANASSTASTSSGATATSSETAKANTETKSKSSAYRLFRTVSFFTFCRLFLSY